jgi:hypothetical protein
VREPKLRYMVKVSLAEKMMFELISELRFKGEGGLSSQREEGAGA